MKRAHPLRIADYLQHILDAIDNIQTYTASMDACCFQGRSKTQDAVIRNLEIIGEACNNISKKHSAFAVVNSSVPWGFAYEMRNALSHGYFSVDLDIVWQTTVQNLPGLQSQISILLTATKAQPTPPA